MCLSNFLRIFAKLVLLEAEEGMFRILEAGVNMYDATLWKKSKRKCH